MPPTCFLNFISLTCIVVVVQSCPTLCDPVDCSTPGLSVSHHLLEFAQVHVHCIGDAIQPSHPLVLKGDILLTCIRECQKVMLKTINDAVLALS